MVELTRFSNLNPNHLSNSESSPFTKYDKFSMNSEYQSSLRFLLFGKNHISFYSTIATISKDPQFLLYLKNPTRLQSFLLFKKFSKIINLSYNDYIQDPRKIHSFFDALYSFDNATGLRFGVDFDLYLRSLLNFGTNKHLIFIKKLFNMTELGCFALGELAHGSNIRDIKTTANFIQETDEFILNSRSELGYKFWIGSSKEIANIAVVFAKLIINDQDLGVHIFVVPLRNKHNHSLLPGIYIGDCGKKMGLNRKDEGFIIFKNVRIPRDNMLDRYSKITPKGEYISQIKTEGDRFGFLIGSIMNEPRILSCNRCLINLLNGITITMRFVCFRRQFNRKIEDSQEVQIIEYTLTQYRLFPILAGCFVQKIAAKRLYDIYEELRPQISELNNPKITELHAVISAIKPITTWFSRNGLMNCREICGGLGFSAINRLGELYSDNNVNVVWEGDNYVLLQQTARYILEFVRHLKQTSNKDNQKNMMDFLRNNPEADFSAKNTIIKDKKDLLNINLVEKIYENRLCYLIKKSTNVLNKNIDELPNVYSAWNKSQIYYLKNMSIAYGDLFILKENIKEINNSNYNKDAIKSLKLMACLWSLNNIYENIGDFLGYFSKENLNDIKDLIMELCLEIKDKCISIIDAVCVPDEILNSPIGMKNKEIYSTFLEKLLEEKPKL